MDRIAFAVTPGLKHRFTPRQLAVLGSAIGEDAAVELTVFHQLLVQMDGSRAGEARAALHAEGLKTYAVGPVVKNLRACSFCQGDEVEGYATAVALDEAAAGMPVPFTLRVGYSGCTNGCSDPLMHDIGVVKTGDGFSIYAGGRTGSLTPHPGVLVAEAVPEGALLAKVQALIAFYQREGQGRERFWKFVDRVGATALVRAI